MVATPPLYRQTFVRLLGFLKPYKWSLILSITLAVASQAAALAISYLTATGLERARRRFVMTLFKGPASGNVEIQVVGQ